MKAAAVLFIIVSCFTDSMVHPSDIDLLLLNQFIALLAFIITSVIRNVRRKVIHEAVTAQATSTAKADVQDAVQSIVHDNEQVMTQDDVHNEKQDAPWVFPYKGNNRFAGKRVLITGEMKDYTRQQVIDIITNNGGTAFEKEPNEYNMILAGQDADSNLLAKAYQRCINVMYEMDFAINARHQLSLTLEEFIDLLPHVEGAKQ